MENQGTVTGDALDENGNPIAGLQASDDSDNGTDPNGENGEDNGDGTFANDPTPIIIADIAVAKRVIGSPVQLTNDNFAVTYELVVENIGTVDLSELTLSDDIRAQFGSAFVSAGNLSLASGPTQPLSNVVLNSSWDGDGITDILDEGSTSELSIGDSFAIRFVVEVDPDASGTSGPLNNQATVACLLYTSPSPRDRTRSRMPSSA